ncbi:hypothetical protein M9H77_04420 [Catharanthus roseus]|uniref:Uncharacterized protein n=1 Tax=Catharanthus roseus TaxID=4058 RepID=A0ACC0CE91_CATRO|nr:hypothetical protein M9H77_04420 [Catharanthus roseus]
MVCPSGRRGDDDLCPVTDRTGQVQGRTVTASFRIVRGQHSTSDLPSTSTPLPAGFYYDTGAPGFSTQPLHVPFRSRPPHPSHLSHTPVPYEAYGSAYPHSQPPPAVYDPTHGYTAGDCGVSSFEPFIGRRHSADLGVEADRGGVLCPAMIELHVTYSTCWTLALGEGYEIGWKVSLGCWSLLEVFIFLLFCCELPYIQQYPMLGYKTEHKLLDIQLQLDMMSTEKVRWTSYRLQEIRDCWVYTWHRFIAYFDVIESYMTDRREDVGKEEKFDRIVDLLSRHYRSTY